MPQSTTAHTTQEGRPAPLKIGDPAPEVRLPDLMGQEVRLAHLRGNKTLLLFWSPECSHCQKKLPDLKKLEANRLAGTPEILVVSEGTEEHNLRMGLRSPVALDNEYPVADAHGVEGTPSAVLVDEEGTHRLEGNLRHGRGLRASPGGLRNSAVSRPIY